MKYRFLFTTLIAFTMSQTSTVYANEHLENFKEAISVIGSSAGNICQTVPMESSKKEKSLKVKVELPELFEKLLRLGIDVTNRDESSKGVLQEDLVEALRACHQLASPPVGFPVSSRYTSLVSTREEGVHMW